MKNAILKFSLTALATLTLAACGSSGGGDAGSRSQAPTKDKPAAQTTQPAKNKPNLLKNRRIQVVQYQHLQIIRQAGQ